MSDGFIVCGNIGVKAKCEIEGRAGTADTKVVSQVAKFVKASMTVFSLCFYFFI